MKRFWQSAIIMFLVSDGVLLLLFGRRWVRFTRFGNPGGVYYGVLTWFLTWPIWLLRALGVLEAAVGLDLFRNWDERRQEAH